MSELIVTGFQLSPQQKHLWVVDAENPAFHATLAVRLEGRLSSAALRGAVQAVVARHEILRTTFPRRPGMKLPVQVVNQQLPPSWQEVDLRTMPAAQQDGRIQQLFGEEARRPFALDRGPVVRATLIALSEEKHVLLLGLLSLCADAASLRNLAHEIGSFYGGQSPDAEEVFQYADFSAWQNELLEQEDQDTKEGKDYWRKQGFDSVSAVKLPFAARPQQLAAFQPETVPVELAGEVAQQSDSADFFAACWQILQWQLTGQNEIVVGHISDGRNHDELGGAIGLFAKSLPVRYEFDGNRSFAQVLDELRLARAEADHWQDYISLDETSQNQPISFVADEVPSKQSANGVTFAVLKQDAVNRRFRMQLHCVLANRTCTAELRYDPQFFSRAAAERIAGYFAGLVKSAANNPNSAIVALEIMSGRELGQVVARFNQTTADYPREKCIHYLFEEQAQKNPQQPALRFGEACFTYAELNSRANQLAHMLRKHAVKADVAVGLCVERSAEMIVAMLGILKAGGAYVPLIPDNPKARLAHQLAETKAPVLITEERFLANLPEFSGQIICLGRDAKLLVQEPTSNPDHITRAENMVYVIYTSGSTGVPKGVVVCHSNLVNYSHFISQKLQASQGALNFATASTLGADLGNTSIFPSLISGGCLHVIEYETAMAGNLFADYVKRHPIDVLKITPAQLSALLSSPGGAAMLPRKYLIVGGEACSWDLVRRVAQAGKCAVINHYGPTEATVGCCTFSVADTDVSAWAPAAVPIGRPIANAQIYVLNQGMELVPPGVPGELCIGGAGIAKGYLNQPQQTAERFVADPFSKDPGPLYRTGDLARFLPDGNVEFLGRIDQQVKIRGFRVEPAEIESVLKQHSAVREVVVVPQEDKSGDKRLVAYVVGGKPSPSTEDLRSYLQTKLPDYMVPSAIVKLEMLPLTPNGKVDVHALPSVDEVTTVTQRIFMAPRNPVEQGLSEIWREVLGLEQVGVQDNFFEVGGHSLLATQVVSRVRTTFRVQLPLRSLFDSPTVAGLADQISRLQPQSSEEDEITKLLGELEGISDEEAERLLADELQKKGNDPGSGNR
jgi:amino acid adenylation domain-containing protein